MDNMSDRVKALESEVETLDEAVGKLCGLVNRLSAVVEGMVQRTKSNTQVLNDLIKTLADQRMIALRTKASED